MTGDLANEFFEALIVLGPLFDFRSQFHGDIDGGGPSFLFEGQMPSGRGATGAFKGAEGSLDKGADLADLFERGLSLGGMPILNQKGCFHVNKLIYLLKRSSKKAFPKKNNWQDQAGIRRPTQTAVQQTPSGANDAQGGEETPS